MNLLNESVTRNLNIVNDQSNMNYSLGIEIICCTEVLKSNLCDYNDVYILARGDSTIIGHDVTHKIWTTFTKCITKVDGTTVDNAEDLDVAMPMYNLLEYSSNYYDTTGSLWFYFTDEAANFNSNIVYGNNFKSFKHKAKLLEKAVADGVNGILRKTRIAVLSNYLSNFWRSLEMPLINCKVELKLKLMNHCVLAAAGSDNENASPDKIIFNIKNTKLYFPVVTLLPEDNQTLQNFLEKDLFKSRSQF